MILIKTLFKNKMSFKSVLPKKFHVHICSSLKVFGNLCTCKGCTRTNINELNRSLLHRSLQNIPSR